MRFKKLNSKNVILSMILCYIASFSLLNADNLKECQSEEDTQTGCVVKVYDESGNLQNERPYKNGKAEGIEKHYYESGDILAEIPYTNDKINGIVKLYDKGKKLIWQANAQNGKLGNGKCSNDKVMTNAHLTRLTNEINYSLIDFDYWFAICKK